jgi:hypothetical protein
MKEFDPIRDEIKRLLIVWEPLLLSLHESAITEKRNMQQRTIKQIVGHLADSASNNTHRVVHLQYQQSPLRFPNYASHGNNDRWIAIQDYQHEDWNDLVMLWKYANLHWVHIIGSVDPARLDHVWQSDENKFVSLRENIVDYLRHFKLHLSEIEELIQ